MSVTTVASPVSSVPVGTAISTTIADGGLVQVVQAAALPLPTGAATEAGHLAAIDTSCAKIPSQGQALAAASVPVVLTAIQQAALTPPAAITGFALEAGHLAAIDTSCAKIPSQGQALAAASVPVVLTAIQQAALTPPAAIAGFNLETTQTLVKAKTDNLDVALSTRLKPADTLAAVTNLAQLAGTAPVMKAASTAAAAADAALVVGLSPNSPVLHKASDLAVTTLSASATAVTLTIPAAAAGLFHYITRIEIVRVSTAAVTGSAVLGYTSTNLPGSWARSAGNAIAIGATVKDVDETLASPLKSSAAATNTTIVAPSGGTGVQVRITVYYYTGP